MEKFSPDMVMKGLRKMKELTFLHVSLQFIDASKSDYSRQNWKSKNFPNALRYLCWNDYPYRSLPKKFQADNLVSLEMVISQIVQLWGGGERKVELWIIDSFPPHVNTIHPLCFYYTNIQLIFCAHDIGS